MCYNGITPEERFPADTQRDSKMAAKMDIDQRFMMKVVVDDETGCWEWQAYTDRDGYGQFKVDGVARKAHRFSYQRYIGDIPTDRPELDHLCCNRSCCNPEHLEPVTRTENMERMFAHQTALRLDRMRHVETHTTIVA